MALKLVKTEENEGEEDQQVSIGADETEQVTTETVIDGSTILSDGTLQPMESVITDEDGNQVHFRSFLATFTCMM